MRPVRPLRGLFVNSRFHKCRCLFTVLCEVFGQFKQIANSSLTPNEFHAVAFNFLALRIASWNSFMASSWGMSPEVSANASSTPARNHSS